MRASESDRAITCPASLIQLGTRGRYDKATDAASWGTLAHWWKEHDSTGMPGASPKDVDTLEKKLLLSGTERDNYWFGGGRHEVSFAIHLDTLEVQQHANHPYVYSDRDDWKASFDASAWLTGTIDWLHWGDDKTVPWADDLKTGRWPVDPKVSLQLRSYALLPWVVAGCRLDWECAVSITTWEKYPLDGRPHRSSHRLSGLDMLEHLEALRWTVAHPSEVHVLVPTDKLYEWGARAGERMEYDSPCPFCPNRMTFPASVWLQNWKYARLVSCQAGIMSVLEPCQT